MAFSINFTDDPVEYPYDDPATCAQVGRLVLGDYSETFISSLFAWTRSDYEAQWREAIQSLLGGATKAALIVEYLHPEARLEWWPLYRVGEAVFVQNHLPSPEQFGRPFVPSEATSFLKARVTNDEDGNLISEWEISMDDIRAFGDRLNLHQEDLEDIAIATERLRNPGETISLEQLKKSLNLDK